MAPDTPDAASRPAARSKQIDLFVNALSRALRTVCGGLVVGGFILEVFL
jgi:hypothetical protein